MSKSATASASKQPTEIAAQPATPTPAIGQPQPQPAVQAQLPRAQPGAPKAVATDVRPIEEAPPGEPVFPGPSLGPAASPSDYRGRDAFSLPEDAQSSPNFPSGDPRRAMNQGSPMYRSGTVEGPRTADQRGYQPQQAGVPYPATDRAMFEGNIVKPQAQPNYERTGSRTY